MRYIAITEFCQYHEIEEKVIREFIDFGLIRIHQQENQEVLRRKDIKRVERMLRLAQDLNINLEGIEIILNILARLKKMYKQNQELQEKLSRLKQENYFRLVETPRALGYIIDM